MGEPHVAATWFPANDHPRDKARFHFRITVPKGVEAIANGALVRKSTSGHWSTWEWDAREPMATYLATMAVGQFDIDKYRANGIRFWDAIDSGLLEDLVSEAMPTDGSQMLFSDVGEPSYKRLTRIDRGPARRRDPVLPGQPGHRDRLGLPVRRGPHRQWRRLDDAARRERPHQPGRRGMPRSIATANPFLAALPDPCSSSTRATRRRPMTTSCRACPPARPAPGTRSAAQSDGWEHWSVTLAEHGGFDAERRGLDRLRQRLLGPGPRCRARQRRRLDRRRVDQLRGRQRRARRLDRAGSQDRQAAPITRIRGPTPRRLPRSRASAWVRRPSFDRQPEILAGESGWFSKYPFKAAGGVLDDVCCRFALENQTRPTYSPIFFGGGPNDFVVVHELAHQWYRRQPVGRHVAGHLAQRGLRDLRRVVVERARGLRGRPRRSSTPTSRSRPTTRSGSGHRRPRARALSHFPVTAGAQ